MSPLEIGFFIDGSLVIFQDALAHHFCAELGVSAWTRPAAPLISSSFR